MSKLGLIEALVMWKIGLVRLSQVSFSKLIFYHSQWCLPFRLVPIQSSVGQTIVLAPKIAHKNKVRSELALLMVSYRCLQLWPDGH